MVKPIRKNEDIKSNFELQETFKERFRMTINKQLKYGLTVISYREILDEGMSSKSFYEVLNEFKNVGWNIKIKEFDVEFH